MMQLNLVKGDAGNNHDDNEVVNDANKDDVLHDVRSF